MWPSIGVIDYGAGNIRSLLNALQKLGAKGDLVTDATRICGYDSVILPGVGAFGRAMCNLQESGLADALDKHVARGKPLLGICLGMQLMCTESLENGRHRGFAWIDAIVKRLPEDDDLKVPHIGWNELRIAKQHPVATGLENGSDVYFVHSYFADCLHKDDLLFSCDYSPNFSAAAGFARENIVGLQFHPEKSQTVGLRMLENFLQPS